MTEAFLWLPEGPRRDLLKARAVAALKGVGDASLGEWEDWTGRAFHLRRRLSGPESQAIGPVLDIRGTPEAQRRLAAVAKWLPVGWTE